MWVYVFSGAALLASFWEQIYAFIAKQGSSVYTFVHNHHEDYFFHLHVMRQGYEGAWTVLTRMTPEEFPARFATPFFLLLGKLGQVLPLGMGELYTLARIVGACALFLVIWRLLCVVFPHASQRVLAFVLTITGTYLPTLAFERPVLISTIWTELDPLMRMSFVPHHLMSKVLMVYLFVLFLTKRSPVLIGVLTLIAGFISPVFIITYMATLTLWVIIERKSLRAYGASMVSVCLVLGYHWWLSRASFPWTTYGPPWEGNWLYLFPWWMYIQSFGAVFPFAIYGAIRSFRTSSSVRLLTLWVVVGWIFIFVLRPYLPFSNSRYLSGYQWIAVGILAAEGIRRLPRASLIASILVLMSIPSWYLSIRDGTQKIDANIHNPQYFMPRDIQNTLTHIGTLRAPCIVAAPDWLSTMIPAYSSCRSISGHKLMTYANDIKVYEMNEFFFYPVPIETKQNRLKQYGITHVITLDGITGTDILPLLAPTPVFSSGGVKVYEVRKI